MKKNIYVMPAIKVVSIRQTTSLLLGSKVNDEKAEKSKGALSRGARFTDCDFEDE